MFSSLVRAHEVLNPEAISKIPNALLRRGKPTSVRTRNQEVLKRPKAGFVATFQERGLSNLLARLREVQRMENQTAPMSEAQLQCRQCLWARISRSPWYNAQIGVQQNILRATARLETLVQEADSRRLGRWKSKMEHDGAALKWLRTGAAPMNPSVKVDEGSQPGTTVQSSLENLRRFWNEIWSRPRVPPAAFWDELITHTPARPNVQEWPRVQVSQLTV